MKLRDFFPDFAEGGLADAPVTGITADSREVKPGSIFFATTGSALDGHDFFAAASQNGALILVGERNPAQPLQTPFLKVTDSRRELALAASIFYENPSAKMKVFGVTGTSGKTTTTYLIESILRAAGERVGVIGTINFRFGDRIFPSTHTTPGPVELQRLLSEMQKAGCTAVVMEVSSHSLAQKRVDGIDFDVGVFNNLSPEHLDFHPDMEDYFQAKSRLFHQLLLQSHKRSTAVINIGDVYGARLWDELSPKMRKSSFDFEKSGLIVGMDGIRGKSVDSKLLGRFNAENILAAMTAALAIGIPTDLIARGIQSAQVIPGRLEKVPSEEKFTVLVDYAHKPDALEKVLATLEEISTHRVITVFGCGGDRDRTKRPKMGEIACRLSDHVIITSDNPRTEDSLAIIEEIKSGTREYLNFEIEPDRKAAIFRAIKMAGEGDLVLIAGKGHEDYQIIGKSKTHFDDREVAAQAIAER